MEAVLLAAIAAIELVGSALPPQRAPAPWVRDLGALHVRYVQTGAEGDVRLYGDDGSVDEAGAAEFDRVVLPKDQPDGTEPRHVNRRSLQLLVKAAAHFDARDVVIISVWRSSAGAGSKHRTGDAIDFAFPSVESGKVAAYLRSLARVGVGIYTNPRTRFVHLDDREQSFHWLDASPPGRTWREKGFTDRGAAARDRAYRPEQDLP